MGAAEAGQGLPRRPRDAALDHARLADGQPGDARRSGRSRSARAPSMLAEQYGDHPRGSRTSSRSRSPPAGRRGLGRRRLRRRGRRRPRHRADPRRGHPRRRDAGDAGQAQAGVPHGRHRDRRQRLAAQRRRRGAAARRRGRRAGCGREPLARIVGRGAVAASTRSLRHRPGRGGRTARCARAGIGWADLDAGRAQRGVRRAVAGLPAPSGRSSTPTIVNVDGGAIAHRPPARLLRRAHRRHARPRAAPARRRLRASPRSASASARAWPSCSRREEP